MTDPTSRWTPDAEPGRNADLEARVQAYLDGEGPASERLAVERLLDASETARAVEARLRRERAALRAVFDVAEAEVAVASPRKAAPGRPRPPRRGAVFLAGAAGTALAAGLLLGFSIGTGALGVDPAIEPPAAPVAAATPGWRLSAATYHRLYAAETFETAPVAPEAASAGLAAVGARLGVDLSAIAAPDGLRLERAQMLQIDGRPLGQIAFTTANGATIALCVVARPSVGDPTQPAAGSILDVAAVDWRSAQHAFLLLGPSEASAEDVAALSALAEDFARLLGG